MNRVKAIALVATVALLSPLPAWAQRPRVSPHETVSGVIDGNRVTIVYGRPYSKDPAQRRNSEGLGHACSQRQSLAIGLR